MTKQLNSKFTITGTLRNGKRFAPIHTNNPWHYNIWCGSIWLNLEDGKRMLIKRIF